MHNPTYSRLIVRDDVLPELQLSMNDAAVQLDTSHITLPSVINGCSALSIKEF
jgi:hypothetical protein